MVVLQAVHHDTSINEQGTRNYIQLIFRIYFSVSVASPPLVPTNTVEEVQENDSHESTCAIQCSEAASC